MIEVRDLTIGYGKNVLQQNLNFDVLQGEIFVILGGSGCGKSTLLRHLIGLDSPMSGQIQVHSEHRSGRRGRPEFGVMFQSGALLGSMTLFENIALPLRRWSGLGLSEVKRLVCSKLRLVGLDGFENHLPAEISGGMKKRAGIARALALDPDLVFLDEPSAGLDPITAVELDDLLLTLNQSLGTTLVIVTHELESIFKIAKRCIMLDKQAKGIIAQGDPRELRSQSTHPVVSRFFNRQSRETTADSHSGG